MWQVAGLVLLYLALEVVLHECGIVGHRDGKCCELSL